jgi:hypothetical protein
VKINDIGAHAQSRRIINTLLLYSSSLNDTDLHACARICAGSVYSSPNVR